MSPLAPGVLLAASLLALSAVVAAPGSPPATWPGIEKSWVLGDRDKPADGRILIGVLARSGEAKPLASLVDRVKVDAFLAKLEKGEIDEDALALEVPVEEVESSESAIHLRVDNVSCRAVEVLADECADLPLVVCPARRLDAFEVRSLSAYIRSGGVVLFEGGKDAWRGTVFEGAETVPAGESGLEGLRVDGLEVVRRDGRVIGFVRKGKPILSEGEGEGEQAQARRQAALSPLVRFLAGHSTKVRLLRGRSLAVRAARRDGDDLVLDLDLPRHPTAKVASVEVALVDIAGNRRFENSVQVDAETVQLRVPCAESAHDPVASRVQLRWHSRGVAIRTAPTVEALVGATNVELRGAKTAYTGGAFAVRVRVTNSKTRAPVAGRPLVVSIQRGAQLLARAEATTGAQGSLTTSMVLGEDVAPGEAELRVGPAVVPITVRRDHRLHVVTDRTLYRSEDTVHARLMLRRAPSGLPAADTRVVVQLRSGGKVRAQKSVTTSAHGIASASFSLVDQSPGDCELLAKCGARSARTEFRVGAFELPRFVLEAAPPRVACRSGESVPVTVRARYLDGGAVEGAKVAVYASEHPEIDYPYDRRKTDAEGCFRFVCKPGESLRRDTIHVLVTDRDGREEAVQIDVRPQGAPAELKIAPLGVPVVGRPLRLAVTATRADGAPARGEVTLRVSGGASPSPLTLDAQGRATFVVRPEAAAFSVEAGLGQGERSARGELALSCRDPRSAVPIAAPRDLVTRVGKTLEIDVVGADGPAFLDLCRDGVTLRTLSVALQDGAGAKVSVALAPDLAGLLELRAYRWKKTVEGTSQPVLVLRDNELTVTARPDKEQYRPGDRAQIDVSVRDAAGRPAAGVVGYWAVDEGLLARSPWLPQTETVFDNAPVGARPDLLEVLREGEGSSGVQAALGVGKPVADGDFTLRFDWLTARRTALRKESADIATKRLGALKSKLVAALGALPLREFPHTLSVRHTVGWLVRRGALEAADLCDPWGQPFATQSRFNGWRSPGPDGEFGTEDDAGVEWWDGLFDALPKRTRLFLRFVEKELRAQAKEDVEIVEEEEVVESAFDSNQWNTAIGLGGGAGGRFGGRRGGVARFRSSAIGASDTRLRKDFPPTLVFVPERVVGPDGKARLEVPIADSLTTWRMRMVASTLSGHTGVGESRLVVTQPFQVEPWITPHLTAGDVVEVPTLVRNGRDAAADVELSLATGGALQPEGDAAGRLAVGAHKAADHRFRVRATRPGKATVKVGGTAGADGDAVERQVTVRPLGRAQRRTEQATVTAARPFVTRWTLKEGDIAPATLQLTILPDALATTLAGFDGLVQEPHGCFEQTSSTLYPMVLALQLMQRGGSGDGKHATLIAKAKAHVRSGCERLLGYEVVDQPGGFSLYGRPPANTMLSAYGLLEFADIAKVHDLDPGLLPRIRRFLESKQTRDGSFDPCGFGTLRNAQASRYRTTAFVAWALAATGAPDAKATAWLRAQKPEEADDYGLALAALALSADRERACALIAGVRSRAVADDAGLCCQPTGDTWLGARGRGAGVETTAVFANALLATGHDAQGVLDWLAAQRQSDGRFGSTFSTVMALRAFARAESDEALEATATVTVRLDGEVVATRALASGVSAPVRVPLQVAAGEHRVEVSVTGKRSPRASLTSTEWVPWTDDAPRGRVAMKVTWPDAVLKVGRPSACAIRLSNPAREDATNVVVEVGLPPGCQVSKEGLRGPELSRIERGEGRLVLYLDRVKAGASLDYTLDFTPRFGLEVATMPSRAYEYYVPEETVVVAPGRVRAR